MKLHPTGKLILRNHPLPFGIGPNLSLTVINLERSLSVSATSSDGKNLLSAGCAFLTSADISNLFPKWKKRDLLAKMIELKKVRFERITVEREESGELFEQLLW